MIITSFLLLIQLSSILFLRRYDSQLQKDGQQLSGATQWILNAGIWMTSLMMLLSSSLHFDYFSLLTEFSGIKLLVSLLLIIPLFLLADSLLGFYLGNSLMAPAIYLLSLGNYFKVNLRTDSLVPADLAIKQLQEMAQSMLGSTFKGLLVAIAVVFLIGSVLIAIGYVKYPIERTKQSRLTRIVIGVMSLLFMFGTFKNSEVVFGNAGIDTYLFSPKESMKKNGAVIHFVSRLSQDVMVQPHNYSKATMEKIVKKLKSEEPSETPIGKAEQQPNVLFILSEAFWDPTRLTQFDWQKDPIPTIRQLIETSGGGFVSPEFGGNTANVEFNVLTDFSSNFIKTGSVPYNYLAGKGEKRYSMVDYFKQLNYQTLSLHPYDSTFYEREKVFPLLGFDQSLFEAEMTYQETDGIGPYVSDRSLVKEIKRLDQENKAPYFLHTISMQNHYPFSSDSKFGTEQFVQTSEEMEGIEELNNYARGLHYTDQAIKELLAYYQNQEQETIIAFYGDHVPVLDENLLRKGLGEDQNFEQAKHKTDYFIWSNKGAKKSAGDLSANYLAEAAVSATNLPKSDFQRFLTDLRADVPVFDRSFNQENKDEKIKEKVTTYQLLQYDMLQGQQYAKELFEVNK